MYMFVFDDVLQDYTSGMALISASDLESAQQIAFKRFGCSSTLEKFLDSDPGFRKPVGQYPLPSDTEPGVMHYVYGGG